MGLSPGSSVATAVPTAQQIQDQAHAYAVQSVAAQVAAIHAAQQQAINQAAQRAAAIQQASLASAKYLQHLGLGNAAKADYANAVRNQTGIAQGFTGQLRTDAQAAADAAQATLASVPGNTQTVTNRGDSLANVLYGLTGAIPANTLQVAGLGAASSARALPAQTLGYGSQQAALARGQGATQAGTLADQIISARGQLPSIQNQYAGQLTSYANTAADNARTTAEVNSLIASRGNPKIVGSSTTGYYTVDPATGQPTGQIIAPKTASGKSPRIFGSASSGYFTLGKDGRPVPIKGPAKTKPSRLTTGQLQRATAAANQAAAVMRHGGKDRAGNPLKPVDFATAVNEMRSQGYFVTPQLAQVAADALRAAYGAQESGIFSNIVSGPAGPARP